MSASASDGKLAVRAQESKLEIWTQSSRARYDYSSEDHLLVDMLTNDFFGNCWALLRKGDIITLTDREDQIMTVRIDEIDRPGIKVFISKLERIYAMPVVEVREGVEDDPGLIYRWRPTRAGGHSIITSRGEVFAVDFESRSEAQRCIENCYQEKTFVPPYGREPTERHVSKNTKVFVPG